MLPGEVSLTSPRFPLVVLLASCAAARPPPSVDKSPSPPAAVTPASAGFAETLQQGEAAFASKRGTREGLEGAIAALEKAAALSPSDPRPFELLARAYHLLGDGYLRRPESGDAARLAFQRGAEAGEKALANLSPPFRERLQAGDTLDAAVKLVGKEGVPALYWHAANLGRWARASGPSAITANAPRLGVIMGRVLELDAGYFHAGPHRYLGAYYATSPTFAGGDLDKSKAHFDQALAAAPGYLGTRVLMAETYATRKVDRRLFDELLQAVRSAPEDALPELLAETRIEKQKAAELAARAPDLF